MEELAYLRREATHVEIEKNLIGFRIEQRIEIMPQADLRTTFCATANIIHVEEVYRISTFRAECSPKMDHGSYAFYRLRSGVSQLIIDEVVNELSKRSLYSIQLDSEL